jgi:tetratricopeptide (TPR) repeat protein
MGIGFLNRLTPALLLMLLITVVGCVAMRPQQAAAPAEPAQAAAPESAAASSVNAAALEKLRRMEPAEVQAMDRKMAEALTLYYDRQFSQALPLFQELADRVETMDIMFWIGTSAMETGKMELAIANFEKMLAVDPNLHRARLELAATYFKMGRYDDARRELDRVKASSPPPAVEQNIDRLLGAIDEQTRKVYWNATVSQGVMWDSNASAGPDFRAYNVSGGTFTPLATSAKLRDEAAVTTLNGNLTYDIGAKNGFMWNTGVFAYNQAYFDYSQFNYGLVDFSTGLWWLDRHNIVKLPVGFSHADYESDRLFFTLHFDPSYEHYFNPYLSLKGQWFYREEDYYPTERSGLDNTNSIVELTPTLYLGNRRHMISAAAAWEEHEAFDEQFAYDGPIYGLSYLWRLAAQTELYLSYRWNRRDYNGHNAVVNPFNDRFDERDIFTAAISQGFGKYFFGSFVYNYLKNDSTIDLYTFDRNTYTVNAGARF